MNMLLRIYLFNLQDLYFLKHGIKIAKFVPHTLSVESENVCLSAYHLSVRLLPNSSLDIESKTECGNVNVYYKHLCYSKHFKQTNEADRQPIDVQEDRQRDTDHIYLQIGQTTNRRRDRHTDSQTNG